MIKKDIAKYLCLLFMNITLISFSYAESENFLQGEKYFKQNQIAQAIPLLQNAINEGNEPKAYNYLALCFYQQGRYTDAMNVCIAGMAAQGTNKKILSFNAGNIAFAMEDYADAERWYTTSIVGDSTYAPPVLNRANSRLKLGKLKESKDDYKRYLLLYPETPQYEPIMEIIGFIDEELDAIAQEEAKVRAAEEAERQEQIRLQVQNAYIQAESARMEAENARMEAAKEAARIDAERHAAEIQAAVEAAKRQQFLEDVAASLQNTDTENMSAGAEGTVGYGYESELE